MQPITEQGLHCHDYYLCVDADDLTLAGCFTSTLAALARWLLAECFECASVPQGAWPAGGPTAPGTPATADAMSVVEQMYCSVWHVHSHVLVA